ncbi:MAG: hypothetical protein QHH13_00145 [Melioribacter sp.]|nr:hypothetical protein [Melioribacter sp.]
MNGKIKHTITWVFIVLYFSILCLDVFHIHKHEIKSYGYISLSNELNISDPFKNESGLCSVEQFFNHSFNAQLITSSILIYLNQTIPLIQKAQTDIPIKNLFTTLTLRSPPQLIQEIFLY